MKMKVILSSFFIGILFVWTMLVGATSLSPNDPLSPKDSLIDLMEPISSDSLHRKDVTAESIPKEIQDTFSHLQISKMKQANLMARSLELRDRMMKNPGDPAILHELGTVTFHLGGEREAVALWTAANKKDANFAPADLMSEVQRVFALLEKGEEEKAKALLPEVEKHFVEYPHFQLIRAEQAMRGRNFEEAGRSFAKAYQLGPKLYVTVLNLGRFKAFMGDEMTQVLKLYAEAAELAPKHAETWLYLGNLQAHLKRDKEALKSFKRYKVLTSSGPLPEKRLADVYLTSSENGLAEKWYLAALDQKPKAEEAALIHATLGDIFLRLERMEDARFQIKKALAYKEMPQLVFALGTIDESQGKIPEAEIRYRRVLKLMPGNPLASNNLAMLLIKDNRSIKEALQLAEQTRQRIPKNVIIESTYGCALTRNERYTEAVKVLGSVLSVKGNDSWARFCLGRSLLEIGRKEDAAATLKRLLKDDPGFERREDVQKILKNIH